MLRGKFLSSLVLTLFSSIFVLIIFVEPSPLNPTLLAFTPRTDYIILLQDILEVFLVT